MLFIVGFAAHSIIAGIILAMIFSVSGGIFFGFFMSLMLGTVNIISIGLKGYPITQKTLRVRHIREITTSLPLEHVINLCALSLETIKGSRIVLEDRESGVIQARVRRGLKSWGENISFEVQRQTDDTSIIKVSSKPVVGTILADYGKNLDNVEKITKYIKSHF